jgi:hypothetical protein
MVAGASRGCVLAVVAGREKRPTVGLTVNRHLSQLAAIAPGSDSRHRGKPSGCVNSVTAF